MGWRITCEITGRPANSTREWFPWKRNPGARTLRFISLLGRPSVRSRHMQAGGIWRRRTRPDIERCHWGRAREVSWEWQAHLEGDSAHGCGKSQLGGNRTIGTPNACPWHFESIANLRDGGKVQSTRSGIPHRTGARNEEMPARVRPWAAFAQRNAQQAGPTSQWHAFH